MTDFIFLLQIRAYPKTTAVLVRNHGVFIWGDSWASAKNQVRLSGRKITLPHCLWMTQTRWKTPLIFAENFYEVWFFNLKIKPSWNQHKYISPLEKIIAEFFGGKQAYWYFLMISNSMLRWLNLLQKSSTNMGAPSFFLPCAMCFMDIPCPIDVSVCFCP